MSLPEFPAAYKSRSFWQSGDPVQPFIATETLLSAAQQCGAIDGLPMEAAEVKQSSQGIREAVAAERLWLLGYLNLSNKRQARKIYNENPTAFTEAVKLFQTECKLKVDGWFGPISWKVLEDLVAFENDQLNPSWLKNKTFMPILRAAQCRFNALGLSAKKLDQSFRSLDGNAIKRFNRLIIMFDVLPLKPAQRQSMLSSSELSVEAFKVLLDQDRILEAVSRCYQSSGQKRILLRFKQIKFGMSVPSIKNKIVKAGQILKQDLDSIKQFIIRLVQIELWLHGYDISLTQERSFKVDGFENGKKQDKQLKRVLSKFARDINRQQARWKSAISPELLVLFCRLKDASSEDAVEAAIQTQVQSEAQAVNALTEGKKGGWMRLFDGIKRSIGAVFGLIKKAFHKIKTVTKQLCRLFYHQIIKVFDVARKVIRTIGQSFAALNGNSLRAEGILTNVKIDGDHTNYVSCNLDCKKMQTLIRFNSKKHSLACEILSLITTALKKIVIQSWALLAIALYKSVKSINRLAKELYHLETGLVRS